MKRWIVALLVLAALLIMVSPGIIGKLTEISVEQGIEQARVESPEITIATERFDRGWFTSTGRHRIELSDRDTFPKLAAFVDNSNYPGMPALIVDSTLEHGLIPTTTLSPGLGRMVSTLQFDPGNGELVEIPGEIVAEIGLGGTTLVAADFNDNVWSNDEATFRYAATSVDIALDSEGRLMTFAGTIGGLALEVGEVIVSSGRSELRMSNKPNRDTLDSRLYLSLNEFGVPDIGNIDVEAEFAINGFDSRAADTLLNAYQKGGGFAAVYPQYSAELERLLAAGGEIEVPRLNLHTAHGTMTSSLRTTLPAAGRGDAFSYPGLLLKLRAAADVEVSRRFVDYAIAANPDVRGLIAGGFLVPDGDQYTLNFELQNGIAKVNGAPMRVPLPSY